MSLHVYLHAQGVSTEDCVCESCGDTHKHSYNAELYCSNITNNLVEMAVACNLYTYLWKPEELGYTLARELIAPLELGLEKLYDEPQKYRKMNPSNGWGSYDILMRFTQHYLYACVKHPDAIVSVCR